MTQDYIANKKKSSDFLTPDFSRLSWLSFHPGPTPKAAHRGYQWCGQWAWTNVSSSCLKQNYKPQRSPFVSFLFQAPFLLAARYQSRFCSGTLQSHREIPLKPLLIQSSKGGWVSLVHSDCKMEPGTHRGPPSHTGSMTLPPTLKSVPSSSM